MIDTLPKLNEATDELTLTFFQSSSQSSSLFGGATSSRREAWESWVIPVRVKDKKLENEEYENIMLEIIQKIDQAGCE